MADRANVLGQMMTGPVRSKRAMQALLQMDKLDIARLKQASEQV